MKDSSSVPIPLGNSHPMGVAQTIEVEGNLQTMELRVTRRR